MVMALITVMALIAVSVGVLELNPLAAQETPTASRSLSPDPVDAGGPVTVTITADGYGSFGDVAETLPAGFAYSSSSLPDDQVTRDGQTVTSALLGGTPPTTFTYTVTASSVEGAHSLCSSRLQPIGGPLPGQASLGQGCQATAFPALAEGAQSHHRLLAQPVPGEFTFASGQVTHMKNTRTSG